MHSKPSPSPPTIHSLLIPTPLAVIGNRHIKRGQLNYAVPDILQLQRRIRRYNAEQDIPHGDIVALALDAWLRAKGYPPDLTPPTAESP
ncbi:hypothetical protein [Streptomyces acidicola]|uniref:hypothetical protein n=1 Tax=Streptomyces acidicola TaxID=2596892 RepID=UPI00344A5CC3